jgi:acyl-CoA synthetase (NDP forming)
VSRKTEERVAAVLSPNMSPENPVDMWDGEADVRGHAEKVMLPLVEDEATAIGIVFCDFGAVDPDPDCFAASLSDVVRAVSAQTDKPVVAGTYTSRQLSPERMIALADAGIPTLDGMRSALLAVGHSFAYRDRRASLPLPAAPPPADPAVVARWRARLAAGGMLFEAEAMAMLTDFGVPAVPVTVVASEEDALDAAAQAGGAVVLKTGEPIAHKSEHGGVHVGLRGSDAVAGAYRDLATRLGPRVLVAPMAPSGVEIAFGVTVDQFGPVLMLAAGGTLVEVLEDRCFLLAPVTPEDVERALGELRVAALLRGVRGKAPADVAALCQAASRLSVLAAELGDVLAEIDVNPMIAGPDGCVAVDAIVVPQEPHTKTEDQHGHD